MRLAHFDVSMSQIARPASLAWPLKRRTGLPLRGDPDHPYTRGSLCNKVVDYLSYARSPERVLYPLSRIGAKGSGEAAASPVASPCSISALTAAGLDGCRDRCPKLLCIICASPDPRKEFVRARRLRGRGSHVQGETHCQPTARPRYDSGGKTTTAALKSFLATANCTSSMVRRPSLRAGCCMPPSSTLRPCNATLWWPAT